MGFSATAVFIATFFIACGVGLLLFPQQLEKGKIETKMGGHKKYIAGVAALVIAIAVIGLVSVTNGGFPGTESSFHLKEKRKVQSSVTTTYSAFFVYVHLITAHNQLMKGFLIRASMYNNRVRM